MVEFECQANFWESTRIGILNFELKPWCRDDDLIQSSLISRLISFQNTSDSSKIFA